MRNLIALLSFIALTGCASHFTARPPVIEDKVGIKGKETVGTLATSPDYRVVYVRLHEDAKLCAEAPADAGAQFSSSFAAGLKSPLGVEKEISAEARISLAVAMKQLFKRSQGIQLFRDASFALCNLYLNKGLKEDQYLDELKEIRKSAVFLIEKEIPFLDKVTIDPIVVPISVPTELKKDSSDKKQ